MPRTRKTHSPLLKAKVAVEAIKGQRTTSEIAQTFGVHPNLVASWKKHALELLPELFTPQTGTAGGKSAQETAKENELYQQIGQLKVELDFLKKKAALFDN